TVLGLSQEKLGEALGLTFQQIQKYERGTNRIGASRLYDLSHVLGVSISYFFDEMTDAAGANAAPRLAVADRFPAGAAAVDPLTKRETLELVRAYYKVRDPAIRKRLFELARSLSPTESPDP
ncbi:MAG: helix-turn-helix domain-containing protein, partial [Rickettsiales bacterium]